MQAQALVAWRSSRRALRQQTAAGIGLRMPAGTAAWRRRAPGQTDQHRCDAAVVVARARQCRGDVLANDLLIPLRHRRPNECTTPCAWSLPQQRTGSGSCNATYCWLPVHHEMKCAFGSGVELTETDLPLNDGLCPLGEGRWYGGRDAPLARTEGLRRTGTLVRPAKPGGVHSPAGNSSVSASHALVDYAG